jgi:hypothetical protein
VLGAALPVAQLGRRLHPDAAFGKSGYAGNSIDGSHSVSRSCGRRSRRVHRSWPTVPNRGRPGWGQWHLDGRRSTQQDGQGERQKTVHDAKTSGRMCGSLAQQGHLTLQQSLLRNERSSRWGAIGARIRRATLTARKSGVAESRPLARRLDQDGPRTIQRERSSIDG